MPVQALTTKQVLDLCSIAPSTLDYWVKKKLVVPSVLSGAGHRYERYWSVEDAVMVRTIKALRDAGCPLQRVVKARAYIDELAPQGGVGGRALYWTGEDVILGSTPSDLISLVRHPGQQMLVLAALPVEEWIVVAASRAQPCNVRAIKRTRRETRRRTSSRTPTVEVVLTSPKRTRRARTTAV